MVVEIVTQADGHNSLESGRLFLAQVIMIRGALCSEGRGLMSARYQYREWLH